MNKEQLLVSDVRALRATIVEMERQIAETERALIARHAPVKAGDKIAIFVAEDATALPDHPMAGVVYRVNAVAPIIGDDPSFGLAWQVQLFSCSESGRFDMYRYSGKWNFGPDHAWEIVKEGK